MIVPVAHAPMSVTLTLDDEVDVSRGDVISTTPLHTTRRLSANVVWMDERPLDPDRVYLLKHAAKTGEGSAFITSLRVSCEAMPRS